MLQSAEPRRLDSGYDKRPILVFSDGCWESGHAGIGAVVTDLASGSKMVCSGEVPDRKTLQRKVRSRKPLSKLLRSK